MTETSGQVFYRLGAGSFATVYACTAWPSIAVKQVADPARTSELEREHAALAALGAAWQLSPGGALLAFRVPRCLDLYADFTAFAAANDVRHDAASAKLGLGAVYTMERVSTVPPPLAKRIREHCFPEAYKCDVRPFLRFGRIYFGQRRVPTTGRFFNPLNFAITPTCLMKLGLPCEGLAASMGTSLARIHFVAGYDGRDVKFVLGGAPHHANVQPAFFVIDFNQMRRVPPGGGDAVTQQLAAAVWTNDPYVPRADSPFWPAFRAGYEAAAADAGAHATAQAVLAALVMHWQEAAQESTEDGPP